MIIYGVCFLSILSVSVGVFTLSFTNIVFNTDAPATQLALPNDIEQDLLQVKDHQTAHQQQLQKSALPHDMEQDLLQVKDLQTHCYQPKDDKHFDCEHLHNDYVCFVRELWMINGELFLNFSNGADVPWASYNSFSIPNAQAETIQINDLQNLDTAQINHSLITHHTNGLHIFHNRMFPGCYGHAIRDTLPIDVFVFHRFFSDTWDPELIASNLHLYYLDGDTSSHLNVYQAHTNKGIFANNIKQGGVHVFPRAVLGHLANTPNPLHNCFNHRSWFNFSIFMAQRVLNHIPHRNQQQVWLLNRPSGDAREWINEHELITQLALHVNITIISKRPGDVSFREQVQLARESSVLVGPHGSNLGAIILAGSAGTLVEVQSHGFLSAWWANQCRYQGSRWFSAHDTFDLPNTGNSRALCDVEMTSFIIRKAIQNPDYQPTCIKRSDDFLICR